MVKRRDVQRARSTRNELANSGQSGDARPGTISQKVALVAQLEAERGGKNEHGVHPRELKTVPQRHDGEQSAISVSPHKASDTTITLTGPPSPTKSQMLPPPSPRPLRAASVHPSSNSQSAGGSGEVKKGHSRVQSQGAILISAPSLPHPSRVTRERSASTSKSNHATGVKKSQFSTYQQHFSPKKTSKPLSTTLVAPKISEVEHLTTSNPETRALQTELLQLSLLHSASTRKEAEVMRASEDSLRKRFNKVGETYRKLRKEEEEAQRERNFHAMNQWYVKANAETNMHGQSFAEQVQILSNIVRAVTTFSDPNHGGYSRVVHQFTMWINEVESIRQTRCADNESNILSSLDNGGSPQRFIDPLEHEWKEETTLLTTKVDVYLEELKGLDIPTVSRGREEDHNTGSDFDDASLQRFVRDHQVLLELMKEELHTMRAIEAGILTEERRWVSQAVDFLEIQNVNDGASDNTKPKPSEHDRFWL